MSTKGESPSPSDREAAGDGVPRRRFYRDEWRELNATQLVCIATGTVAAMFGLFGGVLVLLSAIISWDGVSLAEISRAAVIPSFVALGGAAGAVLFTRSSAARRAARQECGPAVLMAVSGLLGVALALLIA